MLLEIENIPDVFIGLWLGGKCQRSEIELKKVLKRSEITCEKTIRQIKGAYYEFIAAHPGYGDQPKNYKTVEQYFGSRICVLDNYCAKNEYIRIQRAPARWTHNTVFFNHPRNRNSNCLRLLPSITLKNMLPKIPKKYGLMQISVNEIGKMFGRDIGDLEMTDDNLPKIEEKLQMSIKIFELDSNGRVPKGRDSFLRGKFNQPYENELMFVVNSAAKINTPGAEFHFLANNKFVTERFLCRACRFETPKLTNMAKHKDTTCNKTEKDMKSKQVTYGAPETVLEDCIKYGYLPMSMKDFRQKYVMVFDIETLEDSKSCETSVMNTQIEARHNIVSMATGTNIPNISPKFFSRKSSDPACEHELIKEFVDELTLAYHAYLKLLPTDISIALSRVEEELERAKEEKHPNKKLLQIKRYLHSYLRLPVFGFNSGIPRGSYNGTYNR